MYHHPFQNSLALIVLEVCLPINVYFSKIISGRKKEEDREMERDDGGLRVELRRKERELATHGKPGVGS